METIKKTEEKIEESEATGFLVVPVLKKTDKAQLIGAMKSALGNVTRMGSTCGACDEIGFSWCSYAAPSRKQR